MNFILSQLALIGPFFLLLGVLIFIHEWGHFIVARLCGVKVETFSLGFGPKLFSFRWGDTLYALSIIPLGGYVKMYGDGTEDRVPPEKEHESFNHQSVFERIAIVAAGPLMNLIFAFLLFMSLGFWGTPEMSTHVGDVEPTSAAYSAGLRQGDLIQKINGQEVRFYEDMAKQLGSLDESQPVQVEILRDGELHHFLLPIEIHENNSPVSTFKKAGNFKGVSLVRTSSKVGVHYNSELALKGAPPIAKITRINKIGVETLYELNQALEQYKENPTLKILLEKNKGESLSYELTKKDGVTWSFQTAGFAPPELFIGQVRRRSPAEKAGLKSGDQILSVNSVTLKEWTDLVSKVKGTPKGEAVSLGVGRHQKLETLKMVPLQTEILTADGQVEYRPTIGITPALEYLPPQTLTKKTYGFSNLISYAAQQAGQWVWITLRGFKKLLTGEISHKTLSGVISIGKVAHDSLNVGWTYFIKIMAIISINLFLLNLLPIPVLDGGHLLFYFAEAIKGSPVSLKTRLIGQQIGLVLILSLVVYTIFNDFSRIVFSGW